MLMKGCEALPEQVVAPCKMAVTLVGPQMIAYIRTHLRESPRQICARFRLCAATEIQVSNVKGPMCTPCTLGVSLIKDYLSKPDDELLEMLNKGCEALPTEMIPPCKMAVMMGGKQLIAFVKSHVSETPRQICAKLGLCNADLELLLTQEEKNKFKCVLKCLGRGWNLKRVMKLVAKCRANHMCYVAQVGQIAADCIKKC